MPLLRSVKLPATKSNARASSRGFALVIALGLMAFVLLLVLTMVTLVQVETSASANQKQLTLARQNALLGMQLALGQLQKEMGPDRRISATASLLDTDPETEEIEGVGQPYWTGVWESLNWDRASQLNAEVSTEAAASNGKPGSFRGWLVSGFSNSNLTAEELITKARSFTSGSIDAVQMVGRGTLGNTTLAQSQSVYARRETLNESNAAFGENGYAFWVGDEGVKARFGHDLETPEDELGKIHQVSSLGSPNISSFSGWDSFSSIDTEISEKIIGYPSLNMVLSEELGSADALDEKYHSISPYTIGLLSDVRTGGLRKDLSLLFGSATMPTDYSNQPLFEVGDATGPNWEYLKRYFSRYEMLEELPSGDASLNILDVKPEVEDALEPEKPGDAPIPIIARFQYIFSMYQGYNTLDGLPYDGPAGPGTDFESDEKIVYLMVTPVIYVWNPYNVTMRMPLDSKAAMNILTAFPPLELSFDGGGTYKRFDKMYWFYQGTLIALQTSNTSVEELIIPPGEMRINALQNTDYMGKL